MQSNLPRWQNRMVQQPLRYMERTREQYYSGKADWDIIAQVKEAVTIPVIASGDIFSAEDAIKCLEQTKCDGLMLARWCSR